MAKQITVKELQKELDNTLALIQTLQGIQLLEHNNRSHLRGNAAQVSKEKLSILKQAIANLEFLSSGLAVVTYSIPKNKNIIEDNPTEG